MIPFDGDPRGADARRSSSTTSWSSASARRSVSVGENFRFGNRARGDAALLRAQDAFETRVVEMVELDGEIVSSTHIRGLVAAGRGGRGRAAARRAVRDARDRRPRRQARAHARLPDGQPRPRPARSRPRPRHLRLPRAVPGMGEWTAAVSIGVRPTFVTGRGLLVEAFLLDFDGDLYGRELRLEFIDRMRGERRFDSVEALIEQMDRDVVETRSGLHLIRTDRGVGDPAPGNGGAMRVVLAHARDAETAAAGARPGRRRPRRRRGRRRADEALARCRAWRDRRGASSTSTCAAATAASCCATIKGDAGGLRHRRSCCSSAPTLDLERRASTALQPRRPGLPRRAGAPTASCSTRVAAAARTKVLQEELVAQSRRLESLIFEDALTGLANRRFILTQLGGHGLRRPPPRPPAVGRDHRHRPLQARSTTSTATRPATACWSPSPHALRDHLRAEDQLGRLGGEEFLVVLPDTDADAAGRVAERCARRWRRASPTTARAR